MTLPFRVGIEYLTAVSHAPGVGRYCRELVRALAPLEERPALRLFEVGRDPRVMSGDALGLEGARDLRRLSWKLPRRLVSALGRVGLGADRLLGGVDLFHRVLPHWPPVATAPEVLGVGELPPPDSPAENVLRAACRRASALVVFCSAYRVLVAERFEVEAGRVHTVPVGCEHWARALAHPVPPPSHPRFVVLGALRRERYPGRILSAFEHLRAGGLEAELLFVGRGGSASEEFLPALEASSAKKHARWLNDVREADMPALLGGATALVHLADQVGSPVTPLEAFSLGVDVVSARLPAFEEALGARPLYVEMSAVREDPGVLADAMAAAAARAGDQEAREERRSVAAGYSWEACARKTVEVWRRVVEGTAWG